MSEPVIKRPYHMRMRVLGADLSGQYLHISGGESGAISSKLDLYIPRSYIDANHLVAGATFSVTISDKEIPDAET